MMVKDGAECGKLLLGNPYKEIKSRVITIDGAFMCCTKKVWDTYRFDENLFKGFHFYDLDFSFNLHSHNLHNYVVFDILIEHFSQGKRDQYFLADAEKFDKKWQHKLPVHLDNLSKEKVAALEGYSLAERLQLMKGLKTKSNEKIKLIRRYLVRHKNFYHLLRTLYFGFIKP